MPEVQPRATAGRVLRGRSQVLVIGAGPAGCAAGITLARAGVDVCVVDRARFPRPKTCGDAISNHAVARIEQLGALPAILAGPHALVRRADAVFPDGSRVARGYQRPGMIVPRLQLDAALRGALGRSGARVVEETAVRALDEPPESGARGYRARGPALDWRAELVIAADGPGSVAWGATGRPNPRGRNLAVAATQYLEGVRDQEGDVSEHYFEHDLPCGYGWVFPSVDGVANVGVYQRADAYRANAAHLRSLLRAFLERHADRLAGARPVAPARSWSLPLGPAAWVGARDLLLAGDAGFSVDPLSGEGIWQALETGIMAAETARDALAGPGLSPRLRRIHARRCARRIGVHCRLRAAVQDGMRWFVDRQLYRSPWARAGLQWAYGRGALEQSKSV